MSTNEGLKSLFNPVIYAKQVDSSSKIRNHRLQQYLWRSLLTFWGPIFVLGLYGFIGAYYLEQPPSNDVVSSNAVDARWLFYAWFIIAILSLDWGRAGLANIEAAALMKSKLAPRTASQLMWHVDTNWSNILWWLRCLCSRTLWLAKRRKSSTDDCTKTISTPNKLWIVLSFASALLLASVSLSGLTMELAEANIRSTNKAQIFGPNFTTFTYRFEENLPQQISSSWESGRKTSPQNGAIFYAPESTANVSSTYFDDQATQNSTRIEVFTAPAVHENVVGTAWGISANLTCQPTAARDLQMIRVQDIGGYSIKGCILHPTNNSDTGDCQLQWLDSNNLTTAKAWPAWLNESAFVTQPGELVSHFSGSMLAIGDGASTTLNPNKEIIGQYYENTSHDRWTLDSLENGRPANEPTSSMLEFYIWQQGTTSDGSDLKPYLSAWPSATYLPRGFSNTTTHNISHYPAIGFGLHCNIDTAVGFATLSPAHRTFSRFQHRQADLFSGDGLGPYHQVSSPQLLALGALASNQDMGMILRPLEPSYITTSGTNVDIAMLLSVYNALNIAPTTGETGRVSYPILTPENLQHATYKLLGETLIAMVGDFGTEPWYGDLFSMGRTTYLVRGIVSWKPVFVLLALWTLIMSSGAFWLIFFAGPRWAPTLNGFEMFKFGAQFRDEVNGFEGGEFRRCAESLNQIPGMVGAVSGERTRSAADSRDGVVIGLSWDEVVRSREKGWRVPFTLDRRRGGSKRGPTV